jgi:4-hydroxy-tetrahydrodipicolinate reductase
MVIGTTGLDPAQTALIHEAAKQVPIMWAANMALGVNILLALVEKTASMLDPSYDIEVLEMHHRHKIDAPSGTALALGRAAAAGRQVKLEDVWRKSRDGHTGARPTGEIGFATLRGGEEVGVHTVMFAAAGERLELSHRSFSRETYAAGALRAAQWLAGKKPGLYGMKDVLGL